MPSIKRFLLILSLYSSLWRFFFSSLRDYDKSDRLHRKPNNRIKSHILSHISRWMCRQREVCDFNLSISFTWHWEFDGNDKFWIENRNQKTTKISMSPLKHSSFRKLVQTKFSFYSSFILCAVQPHLEENIEKIKMLNGRRIYSYFLGLIVCQCTRLSELVVVILEQLDDANFICIYSGPTGYDLAENSTGSTSACFPDFLYRLCAFARIRLLWERYVFSIHLKTNK